MEQNGWTQVRGSNGSKNWLNTSHVIFARDVWQNQGAPHALQPWEVPRDDDVSRHGGWERNGEGEPMTITAGLGGVASMKGLLPPPAPRY